MGGKTSGGARRLIVGLGNPGRRYEASRHNVGFRVVDQLALQHEAEFSTHGRVPALVAQWRAGGLQWIALKPVTFMNLSGQAVAAAINFWKIAIGSLLVVLDDVELKPGELRLRPQGGAGGHQGLDSIIQHLATRQFARLRVGIGRPPAPQVELAEWVLGSFEKTELPWLESSLKRAVGAIVSWAVEGAERAMSQHNRPPSSGSEGPSEHPRLETSA